MDRNNILIGVFLAGIFIAAAWWHIRENTRFEAEIKKKTDANTAQWLVRFAWSRTLQLLAALGCALVIFISYDKQLTQSRNSLESLTEMVEKNAALEKKRLAELKKAPPPKPQVIPPKPVQPASNPAPVAATSPAQIAAKPVPAPVQIEPTANETIEALYNPEKTQTDRQSSMDDIKKRYEDILVIHLFLKKCNKIQPTDYNTIAYALSQEMASVDAPQKLQTDIVTAAQGSYNEIYARSPCDGKGIESLSTQYNSYIKILAANFPHG